MPVLTSRLMKRVYVKSGGGGIRTHDSGHLVHGGLRASTVCSKSALSVYGSRLLSIVVCRLCCQFCCQLSLTGPRM